MFAGGDFLSLYGTQCVFPAGANEDVFSDRVFAFFRADIILVLLFCLCLCLLDPDIVLSRNPR